MEIDFNENKRFWDKVDITKDNSCWNWLAYKSKDGYGRFRTTEKAHRAPRYLFLMMGHKLTKEDFILHSCDNPACVNPNHLRIGTASDNSTDMVKRKRDNNIKEMSRLWRLSLTDEDKKELALKTTGKNNGMFGKTHTLEVKHILSGLAKERAQTKSRINGRFVKNI